MLPNSLSSCVLYNFGKRGLVIFGFFLTFVRVHMCVCVRAFMCVRAGFQYYELGFS